MSLMSLIPLGVSTIVTLFPLTIKSFLLLILTLELYDKSSSLKIEKSFAILFMQSLSINQVFLLVFVA